MREVRIKSSERFYDSFHLLEYLMKCGFEPKRHIKQQQDPATNEVVFTQEEEDIYLGGFEYADV